MASLLVLGNISKSISGKAFKDWGRPGGFIRPPSKGLANRHSWIKERECLLKLSEELPNSVVVHESAKKAAEVVVLHIQRKDVVCC